MPLRDVFGTPPKHHQKTEGLKPLLWNCCLWGIKIPPVRSLTIPANGLLIDFAVDRKNETPVCNLLEKVGLSHVDCVTCRARSHNKLLKIPKKMQHHEVR